MKEKAIEKLIANWERLVAEGDMEPEAMAESLRDQVSGYMDLSAEDLEGDPELAEMMGYNIDDMTDEQVDEWKEVVEEAAKRYLKGMK